MISTCEIFEQLPEHAAEWFSLSCAKECGLFEAFLKCMLPDETQLERLTDLAKGDRTAAEERQEDLLHLCVALMAAFTYVPLNASSKAQTQKYKVSKLLAEKLVEPVNVEFIENWLVFLQHPTSSINALKSLYSFCMSSPGVCIYLAKNVNHLNTLCDILSDKVSFFSIFVFPNNLDSIDVVFYCRWSRRHLL